MLPSSPPFPSNYPPVQLPSPSLPFHTAPLQSHYPPATLSSSYPPPPPHIPCPLIPLSYSVATFLIRIPPATILTLITHLPTSSHPSCSFPALLHSPPYSVPLLPLPFPYLQFPFPPLQFTSCLDPFPSSSPSVHVPSSSPLYQQPPSFPPLSLSFPPLQLPSSPFPFQPFSASALLPSSSPTLQDATPCPSPHLSYSSAFLPSHLAIIHSLPTPSSSLPLTLQRISPSPPAPFLDTTLHLRSLPLPFNSPPFHFSSPLQLSSPPIQLPSTPFQLPSYSRPATFPCLYSSFPPAPSLVRQVLTLHFHPNTLLSNSPPLHLKGGSRAMLLGGGGGGCQNCWGGGCELDGAKRRQASATEAARSACRGSCGRGLGAQK